MPGIKPVPRRIKITTIHNGKPYELVSSSNTERHNRIQQIKNNLKKK